MIFRWLVVFALALAAVVLLDFVEFVPIQERVADNPFIIGYFTLAFLIGIFLEWRDRKKLGGSRLAKKTPRQLRKVAAAYQVYLTGKAGNTWDRVLFFEAYIYGIGWCVERVTSFVPMPTEIRWTIIIGATALVNLLTLKVFVVNVPKHAFVITTNFFTRRMHVFIVGLNIRFPWDYFNWGVEVETEEEREDEQSDVLSQRSGSIQRTTRSTSKDGIGVTLKNWVVQWGVFLPLAPLNIRYSTQDISEMVEDPAESFLNQEIFEIDIKTLRTSKEIDVIEEGLVERLRSDKKEDTDTFSHSLEERGGIIFELATLGPMQFDDDYAQAIALDTNLGIMQQRATEMARDLSIDGGQAMDNVLIAAKEAVSRQVVKVETDKGTQNAVGGAGRALGAAATMLARAFTGRQRKAGGG